CNKCRSLREMMHIHTIFMEQSTPKPNIPILAQTDDFLVIDKPAGIMVHGDGRSVEPTIADWVADTYPETQSVGEPIILSNGTVLHRPGIVHRLDKETSGALLIARTPDAFEYFKQLFQSRTVHKRYLAYAYGHM